MLKPKAIDNRVITDIAAADLLKTISQSPSAFEVLLFPANLNDFEEQTAITDVVGNIEVA